MHPVISNPTYGKTGIVVRYYNGSAVTNGYVVKQTGTIRYNVTDGTNPKSCTLAQTAAQVTNLGSTQPTICTIPIEGTVTASGATFTPTYGVDSATTTISSGGTGWSNGNAMTITGGVRPTSVISVPTNPQTGDTLTLSGVVITFGTTVVIGGTNVITVGNLYTYLIGLASGNAFLCNYAQNAAGTQITVISKTSGTANNGFTLATTSAGRVLVNGSASSTLGGGVLGPAPVDPTGVVTPPTITVASQSAGVVTGLTVGGVGAFTALPPTPVYAYFAGNGQTPLALTLKYTLLSMTASGGTGYAVGDALTFAGGADTQAPTATVNSTGAATAVIVSYPGSGITTAGTIGVLGVVEHVKALYDSVLRTVEGNRYRWTIGSSVNGSAVVAKYS